MAKGVNPTILQAKLQSFWKKKHSRILILDENWTNSLYS